MDETLPDDKAITVPVPAVDLTVENRFQALNVADISHFVVQLSDKRLDLIMQSRAGPNYDFDKPWPFWFFIGKTLSKAFLGNEDQLEWFNAVRVRDREFIAFANVGRANSLDSREMNHDLDEKGIRVVEVDFFKPVPGERLKAFWKPARGIIDQKVREWIEDKRSKAQNQEVNTASAV
ncbi:hypothetical protein AnigIFM60653_007111 [Aspergillus niger]|nr:hypothetical protein AnigIFM60653_007111 [Aspergillus niger]